MLHNRTLTVSNACTRVCYCSVLNYNEVHYSSFTLRVQPWWAVLDSHYPSTMYTNYPDTPVSGAPALIPSMIYPSILTNNPFPDLAFSWRDPKTKLLLTDFSRLAAPLGKLPRGEWRHGCWGNRPPCSRRKLKMVTRGVNGHYDQWCVNVNDVMVLFITGHYGNYHYGNWLAAAAGDDVHDDDIACVLALAPRTRR